MNKVPSHLRAVSGDTPVDRVFAGLFGVLLGVALLKFGNPAIMEHFVVPPQDGYELAFNSWPVTWGYGMLAGVAILGWGVACWRINAPTTLAAMPLVWFGWQLLAGMQTIDAQLTRVTLFHFTSCVVCFYLGLFSLSKVRDLSWFRGGIVLGFAGVVAAGLHQHFGGLEQTRQYFYLYVYPQMTEVPPEYIKKISSDRIFSTLFYPNALAGVLLLLLPLTVVSIWRMGGRVLTPGARWFVVATVATGALGCLYWSGSKAGWLLALGLGAVVLFHLPISKGWKVGVCALGLAVGLAGFGWKYAGFFERGATSVVARFDYWRAAWAVSKEEPILGTGPGTFLRNYERLKEPEAEWTRLVHNDYLQQASDSGWVGFAAYVMMIPGVLCFVYRRIDMKLDQLQFAVWLGVLGWGLQGIVEFGLYIPALSWPAFTLLGWLLGRGANQIDNRPGGD